MSLLSFLEKNEDIDYPFKHRAGLNICHSKSIIMVTMKALSNLIDQISFNAIITGKSPEVGK
jgi:hypothetical protein